jgi:hypothetical protein
VEEVVEEVVAGVAGEDWSSEEEEISSMEPDLEGSEGMEAVSAMAFCLGGDACWQG